MTTTFESHFVSAFDLLLAQFGQAVTYTPKATGDDAAITAIIGDRSVETVNDELGRGASHYATMSISVDASKGVADPVIGDAVTIGDDTWTVAGESDRSAVSVDLRIRRDQDKSRHSESHKKRAIL